MLPGLATQQGWLGGVGWNGGAGHLASVLCHRSASGYPGTAVLLVTRGQRQGEAATTGENIGGEV